MNRDKRKSAERLFYVIGMIDDSIIAECQEPNVSACRKAGTSFNFRKIVAVCVSIAVVGACLGAGLVISKLSNKSEDSLQDGKDNGNTVSTAPIFEEKYERFDSVLTNAVVSPNTEILSLDEIDFFDGEINLIWTNTNTDGYYVLTLNESEERVKEGLKKGYSQLSTNESGSEHIGYTVWISYGNGEVVSPELKYSQGNIGYGELFEYSPEVVPSEVFVELIEKNAKQ